MNTEIHFACPHCSAMVRTHESRTGLELPCPDCKKPVSIPDIREGKFLDHITVVRDSPAMLKETRYRLNRTQQHMMRMERRQKDLLRDMAEMSQSAVSIVDTLGRIEKGSKEINRQLSGDPDASPARPVYPTRWLQAFRLVGLLLGLSSLAVLWYWFLKPK